MFQFVDDKIAITGQLLEHSLIPVKTAYYSLLLVFNLKPKIIFLFYKNIY